MLTTLTMIVQFALGLVIIVGLHEAGHLLLAKLFGIRVESYIIGFPPKLIKFKWGETEYAIGATPLGGAVQIAGMIDESLQTKYLQTPPQPWEYRSKPAWQRLIVMLGGITINIISGLIIYIALAFHLGDTYLTKSELNLHGITPTPLGIEIGLAEGDRIINVNGNDFTRMSDLIKPDIFLRESGYYTVKRDGEERRIDFPTDLLTRITKDKQILFSPRSTFYIESVEPNSGADCAGLKNMDRLCMIAGQNVTYLHQCCNVLGQHAGQKVEITYIRNEKEYTVKAIVGQDGKLGFTPCIELEMVTKKHTLVTAICAGAHEAYSVIKTNLLGIYKIITGKLSASQSLSGPIGIAKIFGAQFNLIHFWRVVGLLSLILAFMNLLPIPALDGGHAVWLICEIVTGYRPSPKFLLIMQRIGMVLILALMSYAIGNDFYKLWNG